MSPARLFPALAAVFALGLSAAYFRWGAATQLRSPHVETPPAAASASPDGRVLEAKAPPAPVETARPASVPPPPSDEASGMVRLRELQRSAPLEALALADELEARFADGPNAAERSYLAVRALVELGRFHDARDRAKIMRERFPGDPYALDVERHLLVHPLDLPSREEQQRAEL